MANLPNHQVYFFRPEFQFIFQILSRDPDIEIVVWRNRRGNFQLQNIASFNGL